MKKRLMSFAFDSPHQPHLQASSSPISRIHFQTRRLEEYRRRALLESSKKKILEIKKLKTTRRPCLDHICSF